MTEWTELKQKVLLDTVKRLNALGVSYKIISPSGEFGELVVAPPVPVREVKRRPDTFPRGEMKAHYIDSITQLNPGDELSIPAGKFGIKALRSAISSWCVTHWGAGCAVVASDKDKATVNVLRIA